MITTKKKLTIEQLARVKLVEPPDAGGLWQGVQHAALVRAITKTALDLGISSTYENAALSKDGADIAAVFKIGSDWTKAAEDLGFDVMLGVKNSNARRFALSLFIGLRCQKWKTALVLSESIAGRKREGRFNLTNRLNTAIADCIENLKTAPILLSCLRHKGLDAQQAESLVCRVGSEGVVPWSRAGHVYLAMTTQGPYNALDSLFCVCRQIDRAPVVARAGQMELRLAALQSICELTNTPIPDVEAA